MAQRHRERVVLELDAGTGPISGALRGGGGEWRPFHGWLELAAALEEARAAGLRDAVVVEAPRPQGAADETDRSQAPETLGWGPGAGSGGAS